MPSPVGKLLADLALGLKAADADWYLFGAQAAIIHGAARLTADVDVTVRLRPPSTTTSLTAILERYGFSARVTSPGFIERTRVMPFVHRGTSMPVDAVLAGPGLEDQFFTRVRHRNVDGVSVPVASAEDLIVMKILAGRGKDTDDVMAILEAQGDSLDLDYVRQTLSLLEDALGQSDLLNAFEVLARRS